MNSSFPFIAMQLKFEANHSLETSIELLSHLQTLRSWSSYFQGKPDLDFHVISVTADRCEVAIYRRLARFEVKLKAVLQRLNSNSTLIVGTATFSASMFLILLPLFAVEIIGIVIGIAEIATYGQCVIGFIALFLLGFEILGIMSLRKQCIELIRVVEESLK